MGLHLTMRDVEAQISGNGSQYPSPWAPHMTIAYAIAGGDDDVIFSALAARDGATAALGSVTFTQIAWCGVHQNRDEGPYTFDVLFETPLGPEPASSAVDAPH